MLFQENAHFSYHRLPPFFLAFSTSLGRLGQNQNKLAMFGAGESQTIKFCNLRVCLHTSCCLNPGLYLSRSIGMFLFNSCSRTTLNLSQGWGEEGFGAPSAGVWRYLGEVEGLFLSVKC